MKVHFFVHFFLAEILSTENINSTQRNIQFDRIFFHTRNCHNLTNVIAICCDSDIIKINQYRSIFVFSHACAISVSFCSIRMEFLTCVSKSSSYFCSLEATTFLMKMAETLIRTSIRTAKSQTTDYCARVQRHHCVPIVESMAVATKNHFSVIPLTTIYIFVTCILPVTCGLLRPHRL